MLKRSWIAVVVMGLLAGACGDDEGSVFEGTAASTTSIAAESTTSAAQTTTTAEATTTEASTTTESGIGESALLAALAEGIAEGAGEDNPFLDDEAALCFAQGIFDELGMARLLELGLGSEDAGDSAEVFAQMSDEELGGIADVGLGCVDFEEMMVQEMVASGLSQQAAECIGTGITADMGVWRDLLIDTLRGGEADPLTDPEFMEFVMTLTMQCLTPEDMGG